MRIPLAIIQLEKTKKISRCFLGLGKSLSRAFPGLKYDIEKSGLNSDEIKYLLFCEINSFVYFILFFALLLFLNINQGRSIEYSLYLSIALALLVGVIIFIVLVKYPKIIAGKKAENIDQNLVFALKDLLLQMNSGVTFYNAMSNIGKSNYGMVSSDFLAAAYEVNTGMPIEGALEKIALQTKSDYMKKTIWQITNSLKAGSSLEGALRNIINELVDTQKGKIKDYAQELNLWSLMYMLFAVAIPTIGAVMLIILSGFSGMGVTKASFVSFIVLTFIAQLMIIGFIKSRRPLVSV